MQKCFITLNRLIAFLSLFIHISSVLDLCSHLTCVFYVARWTFNQKFEYIFRILIVVTRDRDGFTLNRFFILSWDSISVIFRWQSTVLEFVVSEVSEWWITCAYMQEKNLHMQKFVYFLFFSVIFCADSHFGLFLINCRFQMKDKQNIKLFNLYAHSDQRTNKKTTHFIATISWRMIVIASTQYNCHCVCHACSHCKINQNIFCRFFLQKFKRIFGISSEMNVTCVIWLLDDFAKKWLI